MVKRGDESPLITSGIEANLASPSQYSERLAEKEGQVCVSCSYFPIMLQFTGLILQWLLQLAKDPGVPSICIWVAGKERIYTSTFNLYWQKMTKTHYLMGLEVIWLWNTGSRDSCQDDEVFLCSVLPWACFGQGTWYYIYTVAHLNSYTKYSPQRCQKKR